MLTLDQNPSAIHFGDTISFQYSVADHVHDAVALTLSVTQNGLPVFGAGGFPIQTSFVLGPSSSWSGGDGEAIAKLESFKANDPSNRHVLASVAFHVQG